MKRNLLLLLAIVFIVAGSACKKSEDEADSGPDPNPISGDTIFEHDYIGSLNLYFSNSYPEFESSTDIEVEVNIFGDMLFDQGTLFYSGESDNQQSKIRREGELTIAPYGNTVVSNGVIYFEVDENTTVVENMKFWVWDGTQWILKVDENITSQWNNGLAFDYIEATSDGAVVQVSNANGTVKWTLTLLPKI